MRDSHHPNRLHLAKGEGKEPLPSEGHLWLWWLPEIHFLVDLGRFKSPPPGAPGEASMGPSGNANESEIAMASSRGERGGHARR